MTHFTTWGGADAEVAVLGLGRSGVAATRLLRHHGIAVYASDLDPTRGDAPEVHALGGPGVGIECGRHDLDRIARARVLIVSPGIPPTAAPVEVARRAGVEIRAEVDLGFDALPPEVRIVGITGTNGKTTTTALVAHLLRTAGVRAAAAGNIGVPLSEVALAPVMPEWIAVELSSFQLHDAPAFRSDIGILTNLSPDHLDRYPDVASYYADKALLFRHADAGSVWIHNADDAAVGEMMTGVRGLRRSVSVAGPADGWYDAEAEQLRIGLAPLLARADLPLLGSHNVANALMAALAVEQTGVDLPLLADGLRTFRALPHRLEPVRETGGVLWINDSKATNVASTAVAVQAMDRPFVLLLGGRHKGESYRGLAPLLRERCRGVVAYGEARATIQADLSDAVTVTPAGDFPEVLAHAARLARPGDAVLLSPSCSSYDMFRNYEHRGETFRTLVERSP